MTAQLGIPYYLHKPGYTAYAAFNAPADGSFVGYLTPETAFGPAEVRDFSDPIVEGDGGVHGAFWMGRLPVTLAGFFPPQASETLDVTMRRKLLQVAQAGLRDDLVLAWADQLNGLTRKLDLRLAAPLRISDRRPKKFLLALISASPFAWADERSTPEYSTAAAGSQSRDIASVALLDGADAPMDFWIEVKNASGSTATGGFRVSHRGGPVGGGIGWALDFDGSISNGQTVIVDGYTRRVLQGASGGITHQAGGLPTLLSGFSSVYSSLSDRRWGKMDPGVNTFVAFNNDSNQTLSVRWYFKPRYLVA